MKKIAFKIASGVAILFAVLAVVIFSIGKGPFDRLAEQQLISLAQSHGIRLVLRQGALRMYGVYAESGEAFFPQSLVLLPFSQLQIRPQLSQLLSGVLGASIEAQIAHAAAVLNVAQGNDERVFLDLSVKDAQIAELPLFAFAGITAGTGSIYVENADISPKLIRSGIFSLTAEGISRPNTSPLRLTVSGFPFTLDLPAITGASLTVRAEAGANVITLSKFESLSSLGAFSGGGEIRLDDYLKVLSVGLKGEVHLSDQGHTTFRSFMPLISGGALKMDTHSFKFETSGTPPALRTRFTALSD